MERVYDLLNNCVLQKCVHIRQPDLIHICLMPMVMFRGLGPSEEYIFGNWKIVVNDVHKIFDNCHIIMYYFTIFVV
jgi:hypothetical protein